MTVSKTEGIEVIYSPAIFRKSVLPVLLTRTTRLALSLIMLLNIPWKDLISSHNILSQPTSPRTLNQQVTSRHILRKQPINQLHLLPNLLDTQAHITQLLPKLAMSILDILALFPIPLQAISLRIPMWLPTHMTTRRWQQPARHTTQTTSTILTSKSNSRNSMSKELTAILHKTLINHLTQLRLSRPRTSILWMVKRPSRKQKLIP